VSKQHQDTALRTARVKELRKLQPENRSLMRKIYQHQDEQAALQWKNDTIAWLERTAEELEANNQRWPRHAEAYPSWRERVKVTRWLVDYLRNQSPPADMRTAA
jgi:hypothetical protein